ncbi:hypothetical protein [Caballeronia sp. Sq4a]|uniref:hypothetical protein n=1 Tax=Caballeronia sp. Sq4a TaxID=2878152 RepID=UPI0020BE9669|nr:hypothetical protein [Caballeronia sp. Sq4a]
MVGEGYHIDERGAAGFVEWRTAHRSTTVLDGAVFELMSVAALRSLTLFLKLWMNAKIMGPRQP